MKRERQDLDDILHALSPIETTWRDAHSDAVIALLEQLPQRDAYEASDIERLLRQDFHAGLTVVRLALEMSQDEFKEALRSTHPRRSFGSTRFREDGGGFVDALVQLGAATQLQQLANTPVSWRTILVERLKAGRGSAIKGQARGRGLENFVESIVRQVFGDKAYDCRCRFTGAGGQSTEKADFAIPSKSDPRILIEVKAYGATGSKQTDILGDIARITEQKRHDTDLLLVTDGVTWKARVSDLRKLVQMQNEGRMTRIYTKSMAQVLEADLRELKRDHAI